MKANYPYEYGNHVEKTVDVKKVTRMILVATLIGTTVANPACAVDTIGGMIVNNGTAVGGSQNVKVMASLLALDAAACAKSKFCYDQFVDKAAKNPKALGTMICVGAGAWCARGLAERALKGVFGGA